MLIYFLVHTSSALVAPVRSHLRSPAPHLRSPAPRLRSPVRPLLLSEPDGLVTRLQEPLQELPSSSLLRAIQKCGSTATAADIAAEAGSEIEETRRQLLVLARLVGAELQVSDSGEILFCFEEAGALRRALRRASLRQRGRDAWAVAAPPVLWVMRASFGVGLLASLVFVTTAITALAASKDDDNNSRGSRSSSRSIGYVWGPNPLDVLYYSSRPNYYAPSGEMGFLQSCFSALFGDADVNADLERRTSVAVAALVRENGGAVTAEQLAPLLAPSLDPATAGEEALRPGAPVREDWVLPALVQFGGVPTVTDDGQIVYTFPGLMSSAAQSAAALGAAAGRGGALAPAAASSPTSLRAALAWSERPAGWRPTVGSRVVVARVRPMRGRDTTVAERMVGTEGVVLSDDRDALPFQVGLAPGGRGSGKGRATYFALDELLPASTPGALLELPQPFSVAPPNQLAMVGVLAAANLGAVSYLGAMLGSAGVVSAAALGGPSSSMALVLALRRVYPALLAYASGFVVLPALRGLRLRRRNRAIEARNARRADWARAVEEAGEPAAASGGLFGTPTADSALDAASDGEGGADGEGGRARLVARVRSKMAAARALALRLRRPRADEQDRISFTTRKALDEQPGAPGAPALEAFDRRLQATGLQDAEAVGEPRGPAEP